VLQTISPGYFSTLLRPVA